MNSITRNQEYRYQYKATSIGSTFFCGFGPKLNFSVPDNLLDIKAIFIHAVFKFDSSVPADSRRILWAGGKYPYKYV